MDSDLDPVEYAGNDPTGSGSLQAFPEVKQIAERTLSPIWDVLPQIESLDSELKVHQEQAKVAER